jgi:hypothetical protein
VKRERERESKGVSLAEHQMLMIIKQWHCFWCRCCWCGRDEMVILSLRREMRMIRAYAGGIFCFSDFLIAHIVSYYYYKKIGSFLKPTNQLPEIFLSDSSANVAN